MSVLVKEMSPEQVHAAVAGFSEATVRALSAARNEPEWMLEFRLEAWRQFEAHALAQADRRSLAAHAPDRLQPEELQAACCVRGTVERTEL